MIADVVGFTGQIVFDPTKPNGQPRRKLDTDRAEQAFGFTAHTPFVDGLTAHTPFVDGLRRTVEWYLAEQAREQTVAVPVAGRAAVSDAS